MRLSAIALALGLFSSVALADGPFRHFVFGRFTPDMSPEAAMAAAPDAGWRPADGMHGLTAIGAIDFLGMSWNLEVGQSAVAASIPSLKDRYAFDMTTSAPANGPAECLAMLGQIVVALEPSYGAFGRHPAFAHADNTLYGAPWGRFRLRDITERSRARDYGAGEGLQDWTTFAEFDEATGQHAMAKATYFFDTRSCDLRINISESPERARRAAQSRAKYEH